MRLKRKLAIAMTIITLAFGVSIGVSVGTALNAARLQQVIDAVRVALRETNAVMQGLQELMVSRSTLSSELEEFRETRATASEAMDAFVEHPQLRALPEGLHGQIEGIGAMWATRAMPELEDAEAAVEALLAAELPGGVVPNGVLRLQATERARGDFDEDAVAALRAAEQALERSRGMSYAFLNESMNILASRLSGISLTIVERNVRIAVSVAIAAVLLSSGFAFVFTRSLTRRIRGLEEAMDSLAARDFSIIAPENGVDELGTLGRDMNSVVESVSEFVKAVRGAASHADELQQSISSSSEESASALNQISRNLENMRSRFTSLDGSVSRSSESVTAISEQIQSNATAARQQSDSIASVFASIEEMNAGIQNITGLLNERAERVEQVNHAAAEGAETMTATHEEVRSISSDVDGMLEIIEIINGISEQTHLLSMNAAIESAHAGEAGRGFAVVAEEIRKLAESTSENASRIESLLRGVTGKIGNAQSASESSSSRFQEIRGEIGAVADTMNEISRNMQELSNGSGEIVDSIAQVSEVAGNIREGAQEMASKTEEIKSTIHDASSVSRDVLNGVGEIESGTREILEGVTSTTQVSAQNRERMQQLTHLLDEFRTRDDRA